MCTYVFSKDVYKNVHSSIIPTKNNPNVLPWCLSLLRSVTVQNCRDINLLGASSVSRERESVDEHPSCSPTLQTIVGSIMYPSKYHTFILAFPPSLTHSSCFTLLSPGIISPVHYNPVFSQGNPRLQQCNTVPSTYSSKPDKTYP